MAERPSKLGDFKGWVNLTLSFRLKGYVSRQYLWTLIWGNSHTTICRWAFLHKET